MVSSVLLSTARVIAPRPTVLTFPTLRMLVCVGHQGPHRASLHRVRPDASHRRRQRRRPRSFRRCVSFCRCRQVSDGASATRQSFDSVFKHRHRHTDSGAARLLSRTADWSHARPSSQTTLTSAALARAMGIHPWESTHANPPTNQKFCVGVTPAILFISNMLSFGSSS